MSAEHEAGAVPAAPSAPVPILSLQHATKAFGAIRALDDVSIDLYPGEAHALVGENGAGKSTLVKIFAGVHPPDSGQLLINGVEVALGGPADARDAGIAVIYQEPTLFPDLTVVENIFIGRQPLRAGRRIDFAAMHAQAEAIFERLGIRLDLDRIALGLSIAEQQLVEIAKALSLDARVVVMDEPTAALSAVEVDRLFQVAAALHESGVAVLFISHRLEEVFALCQRVTILRDGRLVLTRELEGLHADDLVRAMVGRELPERVAAEHAAGETVLDVERLSREGVFLDISFQVRAGEIVALAGLVGSGRSEVARAIFGVDSYDAGSVSLSGRKLRGASPTTRHGRRGRPRSRGSAPAGARHELLDHAQHRARVAPAAQPARVHPRTMESDASRPTGRSSSRSSTDAWPTRSARSPAATSRRSSWRSG